MYFIIIVCHLIIQISNSDKFTINRNKQAKHHARIPVHRLMVIGLKEMEFHSDEQGDQIKIMQMTDLHQGESESKDIKNDQHIRKLLTYDKPNIVAVTGDLVSGYVSKSEGFYHKLWSRFVSQLLKRENKIKDFHYFIAIGRHDREADYTPNQIIALEFQSEYSLTSNMIFNSSNQFILIVSDKKDANKELKVLAALFVFDSGEPNCYETTGLCPPLMEVIYWYDKNVAMLKTLQPDIKIFTYQHVPNEETLFMSNNQNVFGKSNGDSVTCSTIDSGLFSVSAKHGVEAHFFGHDHQNDQQSKWQNVTLSQGRKSGQGGQGPKDGIQPGAKVLRLYLNKEHTNIDTWDTFIRNADGTMEELDDQIEFDNKYQVKCMQSVHQKNFFTSNFRDQWNQKYKSIQELEKETKNNVKYDFSYTGKK